MLRCEICKLTVSMHTPHTIRFATLPQLLDLNRPLNYDLCEHLIYDQKGFGLAIASIVSGASFEVSKTATDSWEAGSESCIQCLQD